MRLRTQSKRTFNIIAAFYHRLKKECVWGAMAHNPDGLVSGVHLLFIIKNFERIGDYATGIAEQVYFLSEGEFIEDFRPKADKTSWNA